MKLLFRAIVMGFGLAAGTALYKRVAGQLGLGEDDKKKAEGGGEKGGAADEAEGAHPGVDHSRAAS